MRPIVFFQLVLLLNVSCKFLLSVELLWFYHTEFIPYASEDLWKTEFLHIVFTLLIFVLCSLYDFFIHHCCSLTKWRWTHAHRHATLWSGDHSGTMPYGICNLFATLVKLFYSVWSMINVARGVLYYRIVYYRFSIVWCWWFIQNCPIHQKMVIFQPVRETCVLFPMTLHLKECHV